MSITHSVNFLSEFRKEVESAGGSQQEQRARALNLLRDRAEMGIPPYTALWGSLQDNMDIEQLLRDSLGDMLWGGSKSPTPKPAPARPAPDPVPVTPSSSAPTTTSSQDSAKKPGLLDRVKAAYQEGAAAVRDAANAPQAPATPAPKPKRPKRDI